MIRRSFLALVAALGLGGAALAADPGDTLVIEVAGQANGTIEIALRPDLAPKHVAQIKQLAESGAYDNVAFHRVIDGFMAQTGDVQFGKKDVYGGGQAGMGGSNLPDLPAEFSQTPFVRGTVGMARAQDPDSANSQFFIMFAPGPFLDGQYTVVGEVTSGMEVVDKIARGEGHAGMVPSPDYMTKVTVK
ncbi:peptidylprolyl isomerase [Amaricoccus solimangrovi]|uniref:Peptidyl-prolyl cis-trans isomerase n=1 Tax=Amaricoccus solimangrovi TaxID=2589815 RepID=A0A501WWG7_9RHOB|nr:peptidylprolyl isomerase [Amaricoccus solimangrovi]TPE53808.1 peptidylprolyl isomerase [Amaricoccus solimangrovi]